MSNHTKSIEKQLRKQKKKQREILGLKSKPYDQLNGEQKAKLATESDVKRRVNYMEKVINKRKTLTQPRTPTLTKLSVPKNKKKSNVMTKVKQKAYKKHRELAKKEREEQKNKNMLHEMKVEFSRLLRRERKRQQEEYAGWLRERNAMLKLLMESEKEQMEQMEQATQTTQATQAN